MTDADRVVIRHATASDWAVVAAIHAESFRSAYRGIYPDDYLDRDAPEERRLHWREALAGQDGEDLLLIAEDDSGALGFACVHRRHDALGALLDNLHVLPASKVKGIGRRLLGAAAQWLCDASPGTALQLYVWQDNRAARDFYRRLGAEDVECFDKAVPGGGAAPIVRMRWADPAMLLAMATP